MRSDGTVKVLDFGLAKALERAGEAGGASNRLASLGSPAQPALTSPTLTSPAQMTGVGVILGTAAYRALEQARGKAVDKRADIWSFGCVLFEMFTGSALGIADMLAAKANDAGPPAVASGDVEIAAGELVHASGIDYVGPIPHDIQFVSVLSAAIVSGSKQVDASRRLLSFLASAAADAAIQNAGMQRATRR